MDVRVGLWRKLSPKELMLLNCGVGEPASVSRGLERPHGLDHHDWPTHVNWITAWRHNYIFPERAEASQELAVVAPRPWEPQWPWMKGDPRPQQASCVHFGFGKCDHSRNVPPMTALFSAPPGFRVGSGSTLKHRSFFFLGKKKKMWGVVLDGGKLTFSETVTCWFVRGNTQVLQSPAEFPQLLLLQQWERGGFPPPGSNFSGYAVSPGWIWI